MIDIIGEILALNSAFIILTAVHSICNGKWLLKVAYTSTCYLDIYYSLPMGFIISSHGSSDSSWNILWNSLIFSILEDSIWNICYILHVHKFLCYSSTCTTMNLQAIHDSHDCMYTAMTSWVIMWLQWLYKTKITLWTIHDSHDCSYTENTPWAIHDCHDCCTYILPWHYESSRD